MLLLRVAKQFDVSTRKLGEILHNNGYKDSKSQTYYLSDLNTPC